MKLLIVTNSISGGGAESSMRKINRELVSLGIDSTLLCLNNSGNDLASDHEIILERAWKSGPISTYKNFRSFVEFVTKEKPDTLVANCELPELFTALMTRHVPKVICVEHTSRPWAGRRLMGAVVRVILKIRGVKWVTVNRNQSEIWPIREETEFIPNPIETPLLAIDKESRSEFVYVGRLRAEKGIELILDAISETDASIDVYGDGILSDHLKKSFINSAHFHGFKNNVWKEIRADQTLIVASEYEGDGMVIVEAILAGLPVLLIDNVDMRRFQLPEEHYFKSKSELTRKISQVMSNREAFKVRPEKIIEYKSERAMSRVIESWLQILR